VSPPFSVPWIRYSGDSAKWGVIVCSGAQLGRFVVLDATVLRSAAEPDGCTKNGTVTRDGRPVVTEAVSMRS
jgi:hypothetical protein